MTIKKIVAILCLALVTSACEANKHDKRIAYLAAENERSRGKISDLKNEMYYLKKEMGTLKERTSGMEKTLKPVEKFLGGSSVSVHSGAKILRQNRKPTDLLNSDHAKFGKGRAQLGAMVGAVPAKAYGKAVKKHTKGAYVYKVMPGLAAARSGLRNGDVIVRFDGKKIRSAEDIFLHVKNRKPNQTVFIMYFRNMVPNTVTVTLMEWQA